MTVRTDPIVSFADEGLGNSSYLVDLGDGRALVVDPGRDPAPYLESARERGMRIAYAVETHLHADFVSGTAELRAAGAEVLAPAAARLALEHHPMRDGDEIALGEVTLRAIATPGHTPEHLAYLILRDGRPAALFSGGALLPGGVARTDLIGAEQTEPLARALYRSLCERILTLPDELAVYPTHGGGSFCSAPGRRERTTTIGRERRENPLLAGNEDDFVQRLADGLGSYPPYFLRLRDVNRAGVRVHGDRPPELPRLARDDFRTASAAGAEIVDVRPWERWAVTHIPGALSIELRPSFATWLGWLVDAERPLLFVLDPEQRRSGLVRECLKIGYENLRGELDGSMDAWRAAGLPERSVPVVAAAEAPGTVLDVRQASEFAAGHVPGALHVELGALTGSAGRLPPGRITTMCGHGERAATAASLLERAGRGSLAVVRGGLEEWSAAAGRPVHSGP